MNFGQSQEAGEGFKRELYTGVENFKVTHVNPSEKELQGIYGENAKAEEYVLLQDQPDGSKSKNLKITLHLDNQAEGEEPSIKTKVTFWVREGFMKSKDGTKTQMINLWGQTAWLTDSEIAENKETYDIGGKGTYLYKSNGMRKCHSGESEFIDFLRNLLNLPAAGELNSESLIEEAEWVKMFNGDFNNISKIILSSKNKIGLLLGVKTVEDKIYQDVFTRQTLRQWTKGTGKFDYLFKKLKEAQEAGAYSNTNFGANDFRLRLFEPGREEGSADLFSEVNKSDLDDLFSPDSK